MRKPDKIFILYILLSVIYVVLNLTVPFQEHVLTRYGLNAQQARILQLSVYLPYAVIWFTAFWGSSRLKKYALMIERSKDGKALSSIADGLTLVAISMPVNAILSTVTAYARTYWQDAVPLLTISTRLVDIAFSLLAFLMIYKGATSLLNIIKTKTRSIYEYLFLSLFLVIGTTFTFLTLKSPFRQFPDPETGRAVYYMPDLLLLITIIIPSLFIWYMGLSAAYMVQAYRQNVKGVLYRQTLGFLASGLLFVITSRILMRYLNSVSQVLDNASLKFILIIIYLLLLVTAAGFVLIARGTKNLKKIEEV